MSDDALDRVLAEISGMRGEMVGIRADVAGQTQELAGIRADAANQRGEITRLRADLTMQMGRVLDDIAGLRDDMLVVSARLDRVDTTVHSAVTELRTLHRSFARLASRVTVLEDKDQG